MTLEEFKKILQNLGDQNLPSGVTLPENIVPDWESIDPAVPLPALPEIPPLPEIPDLAPYIDLPDFPDFPVYPEVAIYDASPTSPVITAAGTVITIDTGPDTNSVASVSITNPGQGETAGTYYVSPPTLSFTPASGGDTATGIAQLIGDEVASVIITNPGNYTDAEVAAGITVTFSAPTSVPSTTALGKLIFGPAGASRYEVTGVILYNHGKDYTAPPLITISQGDIGTATAIANMSADSVATVSVTNGGNYSAGDVSLSWVVFDDPPPVVPRTATGVPVFDTSQPENNKIVRVTITDGGAGYTSPPTVTFSNAFIVASGIAVLTGDTVTSVTMTSGGLYIDDQLPSVAVTFSPP